MHATERSDFHLLDRWREHRDAHAFKALTQRYGGLVFGICNRILRNASDAEEVAQDCFLKLAFHPEQPARSIGPWLHSTAVRAALNHRRAALRRQARNEAFHADSPRAVDPSIDDLLEHVDEAIALLPDDMQRCIVGCYLEDRPQGDVADALGVTTRTVRRKTDEAIARIRETLHQRGITPSAVTLAAALSGMKAGALPPALAVSLGKIGLGGAPQAAAGALPASSAALTLGGLIVMKKAAGFGVGLMILAVAAWWRFGEAPEGPAMPADAIETAEIFEAPVSASTNAIAPSGDAPEAAGESAHPDSAAVSAEPAAPDSKTNWPLLTHPRNYAPEPLTDPTKAAAVAGMVVDSSGRAIPGAAVRLLLMGSPIPDASAIADAGPLAYTAHTARQNEVANDPQFQRASLSDYSGVFVFEDIRYTGRFVVSASADGFTRNSAAGALEAELISEVIVTLDDGQAMYGKVITPSGQPVPDASVGSIGLLGEGQVFGSTPPTETLRDRTDSEGNFTLWLKDLDKEKEWFTGLHIKSAKYGEGFFYPVRIDTDERVTVTLESQLARLSGTIYAGDGAPAVKHRVQLGGTATISSGTSSVSGPGSFFETETGDDGAYVFEALPSLESFTAYVYAPDGTAAAIRPLPALTAGENNTWDCTLDAPIQVTGEVRGLGAGNPLPGMMVRYVSDEKDSNVSGQAFSDANGAFAFTVLSGAGDYTFRARYQRDGRTGINENMETTVALRSGEEKFVLLEIPAPWSRTFKIVDQFGAPVPGVRGNETLEFPGYGSSTTSRMEVTDEDGLVTFDLIDPAAAAFYYLFRDGYVAASTERIEGQQGEALPAETFVLYQSTDVIARLVYADGAPVANAKVNCEATYAEGRNTSAKSATDAEGWVTFAGDLPATETALHFTIEAAEGEGALEARVEGADLNPDTENDLGEIVLKAGV